MESLTWYLVIAVVLLGFVIGAGIALMRGRGSTTSAPDKPRPGIDYAPGVGDDDSVPRDTPRRSVTDVATSVLDEPESDADAEEAVTTEAVSTEAVWEVEAPEPTKGRLHRLRERLARSNNALGKGLLSLLARDDVDEDTWEQVEEILLTADLGVAATTELMDRLRSRIQVEGARDAESVRSLLRDELLALVDPTMDRAVQTKVNGRPAVILVVGVNGTGKTTTSGKLARVLVADGRTVLLGAADTFRAAAAEQLQTWGDRVGAVVVRGPEGGDPASVAFEAVEAGLIPELTGYDSTRREVKYGTGSRIDLLLEKESGERCYVEVKNTTLAEGDRALFPDAVTTRGKKHLLELAEVVAQGHRGVMLFCVSRGDVACFSPADEIDPDYSATLREVAAKGVEILAYSTLVTPTSFDLGTSLPIEL